MIEITLDVRLQEETVWLSLMKIADLFDWDKSVISRYLRNVFREKELTKTAVIAKTATTVADCKTYHLLYFVIKDHPFSDGNKRIGTFFFLLPAGKRTE